MRSRRSAPSPRRGTCCCTEGVSSDESGQATVEAAVLLPTVMLLIGLLAQPICLLYTRCVMRSAASEAARAMVSADDLDMVKAFVLRRLAAVPDVPLFHVGGSADWDVDLSYDGGNATVGIAGRVRPLPLLGIAAAAFGEVDGASVVLRVEVSCKMRPDWLGGDYGDWIGMWG